MIRVNTRGVLSKYIFSVGALISALLLVNTTADAGPRIIEKGVITENTSWNGEIIIKGDVEVAKGALLTIEPGTIVMFDRIESFGPEKLSKEKTHAFPRIELIVKGNISAKGQKDKMIFFTSVAPNPSPNDWGAVNMLNSKDNVFEYCDFSFANTAVHAHSGQATITNCYFHDNGVAIGCNNFKDFDVKAIFTVENNRISGNGMGLLFGNASIMNAQHNEISGNALFGIFAKKGSPQSVIKYNNIVKNAKGILFWAVGDGFKISENNIADNQDYNLSLMEGTPVDVDAAGNWWGTVDEQVIKEKILDKDEDETLGRVIFANYAKSPIVGAGVSN